MVGNQAVAQLVGRSDPQLEISRAPVHIQTKLTVAPVGDRYEQEADRVAKLVSAGSINPSYIAPSASLKTKRAEEASYSVAQRSVGPQGGALEGTLESSIRSAKGGGQPLPGKLQQSMGNAFGVSFKNVQVHNDKQAGKLNDALGSRAFTHGRDLFFKPGEYKPHSGEGTKLLAHELTHVVQQGGADEPFVQLKRYAAGDVIKFTAANPLKTDEEKEYTGFVVKVKTDNASDDLIIYEVDAHMEGINKSLLVQGGRSIGEEQAPTVAGVDAEVNSIFSDDDDRLTNIIGLPVTFVTNDNKAALTRFGAVDAGDVLIGEGILIKCPSDNAQVFLRGVIKDLLTISKTKSGKALLFSMNAAARADGTAAATTPNILTKLSRTSGASQVGNPAQQWQGDRPGAVINPEVSYQPGFSGVLVPDRMKLFNANYNIMTPKMQTEMAAAISEPLTAGWGRAKDKPSDVTLFHELTHAEDMMRGRLHKDTARRGAQDLEVAEMRAVGLEEYYDEDFIQGRTTRPAIYSENTYRHERGVAPRAWYNNPNEGALAPLAQVPQQPLQPVPAKMPVPAKHKGMSWLQHKLTPGDTSIADRKQAIAAAVAHNQNRKQIKQSNAAITAANTKAASRNALLANVKQSALRANARALAYDQPPVQPDAVLPPLPRKARVAARRKKPTKKSKKKEPEKVLG
jgi:hypothetical protein